MPWIESHTVLMRHRKLVALAATLGIKPVLALGHLHALWHAALEQQEDGDLSGWTSEFIAAAAAWEGDPDAFLSALQDKKHRFLDKKRIHDWGTYAGRYLYSRYHTSNPSRLLELEKKITFRKPLGKPIGRLKATNPPDPQDNNPPDKRESFSERLIEISFRVLGAIPPANLAELLADHGEAEVIDAILAAEAAGKRKISYVKGILRNRAADGYPARQPTRDVAADQTAALLAVKTKSQLEREAADAAKA